LTVTDPEAMPVTTPAEDTVATAVSDDCQVAWLVTSCVEPSAIVAVALNCDVPPTTGAVPLTLSDDAICPDFVEHWIYRESAKERIE